MAIAGVCMVREINHLVKRVRLSSTVFVTLIKLYVRRRYCKLSVGGDVCEIAVFVYGPISKCSERCLSSLLPLLRQLVVANNVPLRKCVSISVNLRKIRSCGVRCAAKSK